MTQMVFTLLLSILSYTIITPLYFGKELIYNELDSEFMLKTKNRSHSSVIIDNSIEDMIADDRLEIDAKVLLRRSQLNFVGYSHTLKLQYKLEFALTHRDNNSGVDIDELGIKANTNLGDNDTCNSYKKQKARDILAPFALKSPVNMHF